MTNDTLIGALIGIAVAVLPVVLSLSINWQQERARLRRKRHNVRLLIWLENEQNLKALHAYWADVQNALPVGSLITCSNEEVVFRKRHKLACTFPPPWSHLMWESQASQLAAVLTRDELERTYALHTALNMFSTQRAKMDGEFSTAEHAGLWRAYEAWRERANQAVIIGGQLVPSFERIVEMVTFNRDTQSVWAACEGIANGIGSRGNLVSPDDAPQSHRVSVPRVQSIWRRLRGQASVITTGQ